MKDGLSSSEIDAHVAAMTLNRKRRPANSGSALAGYKSAVTWLVRSEQDAAGGSQTLRDLHGLMSRDRIMAAIDEQIARSEGEIELKDPRKSQTLANRLTNLRTIARHGLKDPEIVAHIDLLKEVYKEFVLSPKEMTEEAERFCRLLKHRPEIAARLVNAPRWLADLAEKDLAAARAAGNRLHEEQALRLYAAAVLFAIQLSRPLRTSNLVSLRHRGSAEIGGNLRWVKKGSHAELRFAKGEIKNDRSIAVHVVGDDAAILHTWMNQHRPRFLELRELSDTPYIFPGSAKPRFVKDAISLPEGCLSPAAMVELWDIGERKLGLGITPHQIRHAVATLILSMEPGNFAKAASVLGDTEETVRRHYGQDSGQAAAQAVRGALLAQHPSMFKLMKGRFA
ncbi:MAG: hypothetical protein KDE06_03875 [Rhodobacteraceae bacterium]|nr:hypothetical protein [Paracoccaceae bacterium]MCB2140942.1 hypothetical protein [Paracoccaceae bacterium]MCB2150393.1 hypothetical protein [Paracoccaceae bacterium]